MHVFSDLHSLDPDNFFIFLIVTDSRKCGLIKDDCRIEQDLHPNVVYGDRYA